MTYYVQNGGKYTNELPNDLGLDLPNVGTGVGAAVGVASTATLALWYKSSIRTM